MPTLTSERIEWIWISVPPVFQMPVNCLSLSGLQFFDTRRCHTLYRVLVRLMLCVCRTNILMMTMRSWVLKRVDWAKAEAQVEAEFSAQRALLIHRLRDRDYPYPEVINQLARLVVGNFS